MIDGNPATPTCRSSGGWPPRPGDVMGPAPPSRWRPQGGLEPGRTSTSDSHRSCAAGSPLPPEGYTWSTSSSAPTCCSTSAAAARTSAPGSCRRYPLLPVYAGEISAPCLGVDALAFDAHGQPVVGELGELVIRARCRRCPSASGTTLTAPATARPTSSTSRGSGATATGSVHRARQRVITGRSDATLNRGGVRLGTSELYGVVEEIAEVLDSLVVHLEETDDLLLFVVLRDGVELDDALRRRIAGALRTSLSPRHLPDEIHACRRSPHATGKKLELPVKRIITGAPVSRGREPRRAGRSRRDRAVRRVRARARRPRRPWCGAL